MQKLLLLIGIIALVVGLLWIGQGQGYIHWPAGSFMINQQKWTLYGAILAVVGFIIIYFSRSK